MLALVSSSQFMDDATYPKMPFLSDILTSFKIFLVISNNKEHIKKISKKALIPYSKMYVFHKKDVFCL